MRYIIIVILITCIYKLTLNRNKKKLTQFIPKIHFLKRAYLSSVPMNTRPNCMHGLLFDVQVYCCCDDDDPDEAGLLFPPTACNCDCCNNCCDLSATPKQPLSPIASASDDRSALSFVSRPCTSACPNNSSVKPSGTEETSRPKPTTSIPCIGNGAEMPFSETANRNANAKKNIINNNNTHGANNINNSSTTNRNTNNNNDRGAPAGGTSNKRLPTIGKSNSVG